MKLKSLSILCPVLCILSLVMADFTLSQEMVIVAKKVAADLPVEPDSFLWKMARTVEIPLASQVLVRPRTYDASVKEVKVKALHNGREIAFSLEWKDPTRDASPEVEHTFSDGVALQFPSERGGRKPHFAMGDEEGIVNIWNWKAILQEGIEKKRVYATVDDFLAGLQAGNPVSFPPKTPVQNLMASGFGSLTNLGEKGQTIFGRGKWEAGIWRVILKRSMKATEKYEAQFEEGALMPIAFAAWDGAKDERGARKAVSTWYYVALETETRATVYVYPLLTFLGTGALVIGLILFLRKRKMTLSS